MEFQWAPYQLQTANLALAVDEFKFVQRMIREKNRNILRKLNFM